jgi:predicted HicB family RNase H-like nuclease
MVTAMNKKPITRKPRSVKIDPEALYRARVEAVRERKTLGQWLEEAIDEKIERAKQVK